MIQWSLMLQYQAPFCFYRMENVKTDIQKAINLLVGLHQSFVSDEFRWRTGFSD